MLSTLTSFLTRLRSGYEVGASRRLILRLQNRSKASNARYHHTSSAFTIVELLIVIVVIGILATITIVAFNGVTNRANANAVLSSAQSIGKDLTTKAILSSSLPADKTAFLATANLQEDDTTTYQYTLNTHVNPNVFCLTVTNTTSSTSAHIAGNASGNLNLPVTGPCVSYGHTGSAPDLSQLNCPTTGGAWIKVPGSSLFNQDHFCVFKYEAKKLGNDTGTGTYNSAWEPESRATGTPWVNINHIQAVAESKTVCDGCHLITDSEWLTIAHNAMNQPGNWVSGTVGSGTMVRGHSDNSPANSLVASTDDSNGYTSTGNSSGSSPEQRRTLTLSNGEVIWDVAGNVYDWTSGTIEAGQLPGLATDNSFVYRQYTVANMIWNGLNRGIPAYGTPAASAWDSLQSIGMILTNYADNNDRIFLRGGAWNNGAVDGVLALYLQTLPTDQSMFTGFRVAK